MNIRFPSSRVVFALLFLAATGGAARAQEVVPQEEAQNIARKLVSAVVVVTDLPFTVDGDADNATAVKGGDAGVLVLPDKSLTAEKLAAAAENTFVPVGELWAYRVALTSGGSGFASDRLRNVTVGEGDRSRQVTLFFLGVTKNSQGTLELAIFGKGKEPLCHVAVQKMTSANQGLPVALSGEKSGEDSARLTLSLAGQYTATLDAIKAE